MIRIFFDRSFALNEFTEYFIIEKFYRRRIKIFEMKLSKKSTISLNNDTKNRIYLNVKLLNDLIFIFNICIDEIFTIFKFIIVNFDEFFEK